MRRDLVLLCVMLSACSGEESARVVVPSSPPIATQGPAVFIGDSITEFWKLDAINSGVRGNFTEQMLDRFDADVMSHRPRLVHILAGTNDVYWRDFPTTYHVQEMANRAAASGAVVVLGTIPPIKGNDAADQRAQTWNAELRSIANNYGYRIADYGSTLDPSSLVDDVHPSAEGYTKMCSILHSVTAERFC